MIADDIFEKLHDIDKLYTLEELAEMCRYKDIVYTRLYRESELHLKSLH